MISFACKYLEILMETKYATWLSKDARRIEVIDIQYEVDAVEQQNAEAAERDYEASFPGT